MTLRIVMSVGGATCSLKRETRLSARNTEIKKTGHFFTRQPGKNNFYFFNCFETHRDVSKLKFGSSDWTRTSDIRINSPPFYRLNYRGIVRTRRILAMPTHNVKACFLNLKSFAEIICILSFIPTQLAFFHTFAVRIEGISTANVQ